MLPSNPKGMIDGIYMFCHIWKHQIVQIESADEQIVPFLWKQYSLRYLYKSQILFFIYVLIMITLQSYEIYWC